MFFYQLFLCSPCLSFVSITTQRVIKRTGGHADWSTSGTNYDHTNYSTIENGQNTEKSPGDLRRLSVTQDPGKHHQLKVM